MTIDNETILRIANEVYDWNFARAQNPAASERIITFAQRIYNLGLERAAEIANQDKYQIADYNMGNACAAAIREELCPKN